MNDAFLVFQSSKDEENQKWLNQEYQLPGIALRSGEGKVLYMYKRTTWRSSKRKVQKQPARVGKIIENTARQSIDLLRA